MKFIGLMIFICKAQDLQPRDLTGMADPYAKIRLLPDRANVWQTRIHKRTLNPGLMRDKCEHCTKFTIFFFSRARAHTHSI